MAGDKFDQLYNALKADGAVTGTREHFRQFVYAPGKQGYHNRKQLYDALHADGAVSSKSYEEFAQRLGLHAVNPKPQQQKPLTMKQRAQEVAAQYQQTKPLKQPKYQQVKPLAQNKPQQPSTATASGTDYMKNWKLMHMRNDQMNPMQQAQASNMRARMQRAQEQDARQEQQRATPISRSRITPTAKNFNETMQQLSTPEARQARAKQQREDDARAFAQYEVEGNKFVRNDGKTQGILGNDLLSLVDSSMNEAQELTRQQYQQNLDKMGGIYAPQSVKEQAFRDAQTQEQVNRQNVLMNNLSSKINEIYSQKGMQRHIAESAEKLNMGVEEYVDKYVTPEIMNYAQKALTMRNQEEIMPHGALDYIAKNLSNSIIGMVLAPSVMSRDTRQRLQEGIAIADGDAEIQKVAGHKDETYRSGIGTRFASTAVNMAADSGPLAVIGAGASAAVNTGTRILTNGLVKAGVMKAAQKLTAQQMAFKVANMTTAQKIMSGLGTRTATSSLNLAGYSGVTAALSQASTGDDTSLQAIGEAGLKGAGHGAVTGAMFGVSGSIMAPWVSKFGITGLEKSTGERLLHGTQKFGATAASLGVEAGTMMVADNVTGDKDISFGTWLEDVVMVGAFKAGEPSNFVKMGNILHHLTHNSGGNFVIGKNANGSPIAVDIRLTPDEKDELISSVSGKNLMDAFVDIDAKSKSVRDKKGNLTLDKHIAESLYKDFMADPEVSQSTKEKVNAAMGLFNTTRGRSYRSVNDVKNKQILEYTKNGTLLTRTSYKNADERRAILYKQKLYRDNDDMLSLIGYSKMKDMQLTDEDGNVTSLALGFLRDNGYDTSKDVTDPKNAQLINDLRNPKSAIYLDWEKHVDMFGLYGELKSENTEVAGGFRNALQVIIDGTGKKYVDIDKIMQKDPMKRTDQENQIFYGVKRALEDELFPSGRPHEDQSASQGKTAAEDNNLGTEQPNGEVVLDELRNLRNSEQALDAAMEGNDVFKQVFEKLHQQGLTPAQIYDALIQNGLTQEELTPLAQYINANARVQGMQQATADAIEENVKEFTSDWSYHGTLNGQQMDGEQALYVQDSNSRTLLVGSGDVAFDQTTGKAKEGSGDMLVCLDPNTKELVYVKADEVTLFQNQPIDQFAAEYRQRLQMKNSEPYNQAAQEQAMQDAAKAQQEQNAPQDNTTKSEDSTTKEGNLTKDDTTLTKVDTTSGKDNTTNEDLVPQEQPQPSRKFADGTDVPMTTDSKGRPTPDYGKMTPEQSAEILTEDFGENAEKVVDGQIQKAENALKDAEKMKVDYTAEPNDIMEQEALKNQTIEAAKKQLDHAQNIKKAMTAKKVAETVGKTEQAEDAHETGSVAAQKFVNAPRLVGNKRTRMLPDGETKIKGHYEIVPAESLTPSHDVNNGYKKSEGFPTDAEGRTVNDRDYEHDKAAQQNTDQIARKYNGMAIEQVPVVSDEGIVYDGNGRTMAGQKAAKDGTDGEYINDLLENAENFGFTREQIEQSGIEHPRLVMVTDERLPYDAATFAKFNRNEKKTQSNTEQAVAKSKTLTSDEIGAIVAEIDGNGSLDAFFNNSKAINDLIKTLVSKGIIGQNEVAQMMESPERLSAQGREFVKNLLLGSIFKPETIRMLGIDSTVKNKAINAIRSVMDNMKLGEFSLRDEIDQAIQLLYEARQGGNKVDTLLRTSDMFGEDAAKRYPSISQMMALALEGKVSDFRDLLDEYNRIAAARNTGEGSIFEAAPTKEELVKEFLDFKKWQDYGTGHSENEGGNDVSGDEKPQQEASGGNEAAEAGPEPEPAVKVNNALKKIATEITKQTGIEVVTDEKEAQKTLEESKQNGLNVKEQFIGEQGAKHLDENDSNNRIGNLTLAKIMKQNRITDKAIKYATGWEIGADGKWRYEIPDISFNKKTINIDRLGLGPYDGWVCRIGDFINDSELFKAYPFLKRVNLHLIQEGKLLGVADYIHNSIGLSQSLLGEYPARNQKEIDAARKKYHDAYNNLSDEEKSIADDGIDYITSFSKEELEKDNSFISLQKEYPKVADALMDFMNIPLPDREGVYGKTLTLDDRIKKIISHEIQHFIQDEEGFAIGSMPNGKDVEKYFRYSGEVEARNVMRRISMTEEQRRNSLGMETEDVPRDKQLINKEESSPNYMEAGGAVIGTGNSENSAMGGRIGESDSKGNVERDTSHPEQSGSALKKFRAANGEVYGFTVGGKIYLDTKKMKPETPLHEYTHLWTEALRNTNPEEWENVKSLFDGVDGLKDEVQKLYPELKGDALYEEMISTFSGREGAKKLEETVRNLAQQEGKSVEESAKATGFLGKVKEALQRYWKGVADMLHIHFTTAEEVADKVLADWASGFNPKDKEREGKLPRTEEEWLQQAHDDFDDNRPAKKDMTAMIKTTNKLLKANEGHTDIRRNETTNSLEESVEIEADFLFPNERKWFTREMYEDYASFVDDETKAVYDLIAHKDAQGHLKSVTFKKETFAGEEKKTEPSADPMDGIKQAADAFHEEQKQKGEFAMNLKIGKARQDYAAAKESGDAERTTKAAKELKHLLDDRLKQEGKGLAERQKIIAEEIGKTEAEIIDKPWEQMDLEEREAVSSKNPLTESEINELTSEENRDLIPAALAYLRGDKGNIINAISYFKIWNDVRNRHENVSDNSGTENGTQLDAAGTTGGEGLGLGRGRKSGRPDGPVDRGAGNETAPGERNGGESNQNDATLSAGEQGDKQGEGNSSGMGAVPAGSTDTNGSSSAGGDGNVSGGRGRESGNRPADTNAGRKPTAKQGTTFPDSTAERLKQERADYEKKKKDFWNRWKKAGQGYAKIALTPFKKLNLTPEQIEMLPELFKMHLNGAVLKIKEGIYKFNEWKAAMLAEEGEELKMIGLSDDDVDRFIEDYWNTPYEMDGETHTIREWSSIYGNQQLKKKLKEPLEEKYKRQMEAEPIEVKVGDLKNIEETLPYLLPQQQEDVLKAETQFFGKEHADRDHAYGKGYLFTNGTGTGKTYTGLGVAKRLAKQGKGRILFITPSQKKVSDWIKDGKNLGLNIKDLDSWAKMRGTTATTESGEGMVITTFANFGLNKKLLETEWDAVIYDECHRIMENKKGTETARSMQHYMVTNRDENHCFQRLQSINPEYQKMNDAAEKFDALRLKEIERIKKEYKNSHPSATDRDVDNATLKSLPRDLNSFAPADGMTFPKLGKAYQEFVKSRAAYIKVEPKLKEQAKNSWKHTKTIFLSATPFNTRENLDYVEGYIFKYPETDERGMSGRTQFYLNNFGAAYKFRYHRLEQSISNPDAVAKQEVAFSDYLQNTLGTMSGRIIDSPYDYSRDFPTVAPDHAEDFNNAVQDTLKTKYLHDAYSKTIGDYNYGSALFETMKVSAAIDRIKQHLNLGRKVVIFHRRVESKEPLEAPFAYMLSVANNQIKMMKPGKERDEYIKECTEFRNKYAELLEWEKTLDYSMPREQIAKVFGEENVLFFSGKESKKVKDKAVDVFNDDDSGKNIIVIQEASGKEGISLHDTTSKHQRVCITLALPQSPITALQIEGRTYRIGNMSNAIFEYPILGLNSEMMLFGEKFNNQVSTTENLALGSQARNLRDSFANGILEHSGIVPVENQGVGGKEFDAATPSENDPFDNAVLDYYSNQKLNKNNREGSDYFPTPEPLGYKMVEWAGLGEGDSVLEPSAGHGAIARYVPKTNEMVSIEPSQSLFTKLQLKAGGLGRKFLNNTFENYALSNKHDVIVMNPPFGKAGALAIQHIDKAFKHLDEGGRIVAIIPRGSTDKKFDKWYGEQKNIAMRAEVNLPDIVFQQAGTRVTCRVVVLDKISDAALRSKAGYPEKIDLSSHYDKIEDFFNDLRDIEMPERIIDTNLKMQKKAKAAVKDIMEIKGVKNVSYGKTGIDVSLTGSWMNYGISFTGSDKPNYWRDKMANYYTKYDELQKLEYQENKQSVFDELKKLSCKLAGMTEDEMQRYIASKNNGGTHFRMELGKTFSDTKENFDGVRARAVEEKGIVMPNLNKESVNVVPVEKHSFKGNNEGAIENARKWAKENLVTTGKSELPTMRDGTPYTISKKAVDKYLSSSAVGKSDDLGVHLSVLPKLTDVIHESIEAEIHPDYNKDKDGNRSIENGYGDNILVHRLYGAVRLDGKTYRVKTTMQEFRGGEENKPHSYEVTKIELLEGSKTANESDSLPLSSATNNSENELLDTPGTAVLPDSSPLDMTPSNSISVAKLLNGVEKSYDSGKKLLEESKNLTDEETYFRNDNDSPVSISKDAPAVVKHVAKVAKATGGKVKMLQSVEEVTNAEAKARLEKGEKVEGWYDERTGEVVLYMPNVHDSYTAEKTVWHEIVGHKGMRELFGNDNYDKFLDDIYFNLDKPEYADLKKLVMKELQYNPFDYRNAIEEAIARMAEGGHGEHGIWNNLKNKVTNIFREIGYRVAPNTKDIKYLLWLAKNYSKHPESDGYFAIRRNALLHKLERDNTPSIVERNGMYFDNDGKNHDYLLDLNRKDFEEATDGKVHFRTSPMTASKIEEYNRRLGTKLYAFKESTVDHMQSLQEAMEIISGEKHVWTDIPSAFNPLQAQNRIDSIVQQKAEEYDRKYTKPLDDSFKKVVSTMSGSDKDEQLRNAQLYMITKHGLERNRVFFVRDAIRDMMNDDVTKAKTLMKDWNDKQKDLADELEKGNIRFDEYLEQMDEWIRSNVDVNFVADEHDYSGFHGMQNIAKTSDPYDDKLAIDNVMSAESRMGSELTKDFWTKKKAATDYVIDQEYYNGFIDQSDRDYLKGMFQWYVPLRKFDDTTAEDVYGYIGEKGDPSNFVGPILANAKGRSSLSDINVMAQISAMAKSSLINGGKNVVKQHFARFVSAYETGNTKDKIFVEVNPWLEKHVIDGNEVWEEVTPQIPENATQQQISNILQNFEDAMQAKKATGDAKLSHRKPNIGFKFQRAKDKSEHIIDVYIAGRKRSFVCQGNPRAAQALNGLLKDSGTRNAVTQFDAKVTRKIAQFNTSLNPDFMMSNMLRDLTFASANVTKEGFSYTKDFLKEYAGNMISIKNGKGSGNYLTMFRKYRDSKLDTNNERERMFKEFMDNGGQTGFVQIKKLESLIEEYDNLIKKGSKEADGWFVKKIKEGGTFIETANEIIENLARYSTYCTSRKHGRSVGRSIYDAKEVSTNFNRHGSGDAIKTLKTSTDSNIDKKFRGTLGFFNSWMKNHTQFYNAGVQGANLFFKNYKSAWKTTAVSFGMLPLGLGIAQALINQFLINNEDEKDRKGVKDPYAELPEWKRRNNICIYTGHGNFKTIPIAIELRAFFGLGDIAAGYAVNDKLKSSTPIGYDILGQMAQLVPASDFLGHHSPSSSVKELGEDAILAATPTTLSPAMELAFNRDWTGRPFYRDYDYLDKAPRWKRAYDNTNDIYMSINKWANQGTNGIDGSNSDMKGNETLDYLTAPYAWEHLIDSYTGGMGSTIGRTYKTLEAVGKGVVSGAKSKEGFDKGFSEEFDKFDKNQIPLYRVFNYTPKEGQDMQRTRSKWYNYSDELKQTEYNIKQLKTNTPDVLKNIENNAKKFNFIHGEKGKAYNIWNAADNYIQKKKRQLNKVSNPEVIKSINEDINRKMQEAVNDLDKLN